MSQEQIKESRTILRRVEAHLRQSHLDMGAEDEAMGFVDVIHHASSNLAMLNYVTPRKNTAWVSNQYIQQGLASLKDFGRTSRVRYVEGLFPPKFASSLRELGLKVEAEIPIMVFKAEDAHEAPILPAELSLSLAEDSEQLALWWYVWRSAYYNVSVSGTEPLFIGRDLRDVYMKRQVNLILKRNNYPMGVLRFTLHEGTAHLVAHAMLKELSEEGWDKLIREVALDESLKSEADLVFVTGKSKAEQKLYREIGFVDAGSILSFIETDNSPKSKTEAQESLSDSILVV